MFQGEPDCWARHDDPNSSETSLGSEGLSKLFLPFLCITIIRGTWSSAEWQSNCSGQVWAFQPPCPQTFWAGSANRLLTVFTAICSTCATLITRLKKNSTGKLADEGWLHKSWGQVKGWSSVSFATKNLKRTPFLLFSNLLLDGTPGIYMTKHLRPIFSA